MSGNFELTQMWQPSYFAPSSTNSLCTIDEHHWNDWAIPYRLNFFVSSRLYVSSLSSFGLNTRRAKGLQILKGILFYRSNISYKAIFLNLLVYISLPMNFQVRRSEKTLQKMYRELLLDHNLLVFISNCQQSEKAFQFYGQFQ